MDSPAAVEVPAPIDVMFDHPTHYFGYSFGPNGLTITLSDAVAAPFRIHCFGHHIVFPYVGYVYQDYRGLKLTEVG